MIMIDFILIIVELIIEILLTIVLFYGSVICIKWAYNKIKSSSMIKNSKYFNLVEYLPEEEANSMKQLFYLVMITIFVSNIIYLILGLRGESFNLLLLDILVSIFLVINDEVDFSKKLLLFAVIPFGSVSYLIFGNIFIVFLDIFHVFAFLYFIKVYYEKFVEFTETNSLGITIMLLFLIIFISFLITMLVEGKTPIDSLVMVSNAFTSNGYAVLGKTGLGKIDSLILVWGGFFLSGVGTATLAVGIVMRKTDEKFDRLEELIKKNKKN